MGKYTYWHGAAALAVMVAVASGCRSEPPIPADNASAIRNVASLSPDAPPLQPPPALSRRDLLLAAIEARSAAALRTDDREAQQPLDNRRFEFRIRLGCTIAASGEAGTNGAAVEAVLDTDRRRVTVRAEPAISLDDPFIAELAGDGVEAAEGFWVRRPALLEPSCAPLFDTSEIGLVEFFTAEHPRTARRDGRPYEARGPLPEGVDAPEPGSWDLILRGRLSRHRDGRVIHCRAPTEGALPICLISVQYEQVSIEDRSSGEELARWGRG